MAEERNDEAEFIPAEEMKTKFESTSFQNLELQPEVVLNDRYRLEKRLGRGAMGEVWKATELVGEVPVAIKILPRDLWGDETELGRIRTTYRRTHALRHSNICCLRGMEANPISGYFLVMDFVDGTSLSQFQADHGGPISVEKVVGILKPIAEALDFAHRSNVIHRDVKPANIMIDSKGNPILIDFGISAEIKTSITRTSQKVVGSSGTAIYMAPEQWQSQPQGPATDQYSLGVVAYELIAGRLPFEGPNTMALGFAVCQSPPAMIEGQPPEVNAALQRVLSKSSEKRFENCTTFVQELSGQEVPPASISKTGPTPKKTKSKKAQSRKASLPKTVQGQKNPARLKKAKSKKAPKQKINLSKAPINTQWPFDAERAQELQKETSRATGLSVDFTNSIGMQFKLIPAGEFMMGSPPNEEGRSKDEGPQHKVRITKPFYLGTYEVTQIHYKSIMIDSPWEGNKYAKEGADYAASYVSWNDAVEFCQRLSKNEGRQYRLPTEAEWEYACRAGSDTAYSCGETATNLGDYAWYYDNTYNIGEKYAHRVGRKKPNAWGLYDMHGNVYEWCQDWYASDYFEDSPIDDPTGPSGGSYRVLRGGSCYYVARRCRSADRSSLAPGNRGSSLGFRVALVPE